MILDLESQMRIKYCLFMLIFYQNNDLLDYHIVHRPNFLKLKEDNLNFILLICLVFYLKKIKFLEGCLIIELLNLCSMEGQRY